jgi:putative flippase GtrA
MKRLVFIYLIFSLGATVINLLSQWLVFQLSDDWWVLYLALAFGTLAGLVTKYILDKKWIFNYKATSKSDDLNKFGLYSLMGVFTTVIFWGTEMFFFHVIAFEGSQYAGGALGLGIGYAVKYFLDKKYVFKVSN